MPVSPQRVATFEPEERPDIQEKIAAMGYDRMEGESTLWWNRFVLYRNLGVKRSLQKAVERERHKVAALKSTKNADETGGQRKRPNVSKVSASPGRLQEVPKAKDIVVPGSWRAASKQWQWVARSRAWDEWTIDRMVDGNYDLLIVDFAQKSRRIFVLNELLKSVIKRLNETSGGMSHEQANFWIARAQSLMKDIRDEMSTLDEAWEKGILRKHARDMYEKLSPDDWDRFKREGDQLSAEKRNAERI